MSLRSVVARSLPRRSVTLLAALAAAWTTTAALGQLAGSDLEALRERGAREGWTFTIGANDATSRSLAQLCGSRPPQNWASGARFVQPPVLRSLPAAFDWRNYNGCTPIRDQGNCGSCWAFATVGPLECNILIKDGVTVDLSEQWLVSCNTLGYSCDGGWFAHGHHRATPVFCGGGGAVLESVFPYVASDAPCNCPYPRAYSIDDWAYIGTSDSVPSVDAIKQAIYTYGPVSISIYVDSAFQAYSGGVFNACTDGTVNHAVVLVGWDDTQGPGGVWILRNSWGTTWGEAGYMRIAYGCSRVGYAACYVEYGGAPRLAVTPTSLDFGELPIGQTAVADLTVTNEGLAPLDGSVTGFGGPFSSDGGVSYSLAGGASATIKVRFTPALLGSSNTTLVFSGGGSIAIPVTGSGSGDGVPADRCTYAPSIGDGTQHANNAAADTEAGGGCAGGGVADVWWRFVPPYLGQATFDTLGSNIGTVLSVYDDCGGSALACNGGVGAARVSVNVLPLRTYRVRVAGYGGQTGNIVLNIATAHPPATITGRIVDQRGIGLSSVTVTGLPGNPVTDANGCYTATVEYGFTGVAMPIRTGWVFSPAERSYDHLGGDYAGNDYSARRVTFAVAGRVTDEHGMSLSNVVLNGFPGRVVTDTAGRYSASVEYGFTGNVAPQMQGYSFQPVGRAYRNMLADRTADDYAGRMLAGALQVTLEPAAAAAGASWRVDDGDWQASGAVRSGLTVGMHVLEYGLLSGWTAPSRETVSITADSTTSILGRYVSEGHVLTMAAIPAEGGSLSASPSVGDGGGYASGTVVTLTALPAAGFRFRGWVGADSDTADGEATVTMTDDRSVMAEFDQVRVAASQEQATPQEFAPTTWGGVCGAGSAGVLPLTVLSLCAMKLRLRSGRGRC